MTTNGPLSDAELTRLDELAAILDRLEVLLSLGADEAVPISLNASTVRRLIAEVRQLRRIEALAWDWLDANSRPDWAWTDDRRLGTLRAALRERRP